MAITDLRGSTESRWQITAQSGNTDLSDRKLKMRNGNIRQWRFGSSAGQVNKNLAEDYNIGASGSQNINFQDGTEKDMHGDAVVFTEIRGLRITHLPASLASTIRILGDLITANLGASTIINNLAPGDYIDINLPLTVTVTTSDVLTITNNDGSNAADVAVEAIGI